MVCMMPWGGGGRCSASIHFGSRTDTILSQTEEFREDPPLKLNGSVAVSIFHAVASNWNKVDNFRQDRKGILSLKNSLANSYEKV